MAGDRERSSDPLFGGQTRRAILAAAAGMAGVTAVSAQPSTADLILRNAKVTTLDPAVPEATAVAVADGRFLAVGG